MRAAIFLISVIFSLCACSSALSDSADITDFDSCVAAGNPVLRSYPPKCVAAGIGTFIKSPTDTEHQPSPEKSEPLRYESGCVNNCGDGQCAEMVCMAVGCPCAENSSNCPQDCR